GVAEGKTGNLKLRTYNSELKTQNSELRAQSPHIAGIPEHPRRHLLVELLEHDAVPLDALQARYGSLLELVRRLLGVVPNCDPYLEIWPPAFRTYNVMVPNLLNLPLMVWGLGAPRATVGLAMYVSSRTAGCPY